MPGYHTEKQKRQAEHIKESEIRSGKSEEEAERIAWQTVNAQTSMKKRSGRFRR